MRQPVLAAVALAAILAATAPALALCVVCNASVRLDSGLAACFAERADAERQQLAASGKDFIIVDLGDCVSRGSLPTGNAADAPPLLLDTRFVADAGSLECLAAAIATTTDDALEPSHLFDLAENCPPPVEP